MFIVAWAYIFGVSAARCILICPITYILARITTKLFTRKPIYGQLLSFIKILLGLSLFFAIFYYKEAGEVPIDVVFYSSYIIYVINMIIKLANK